jgi:hypothetical protein
MELYIAADLSAELNMPVSLPLPPAQFQLGAAA